MYPVFFLNSLHRWYLFIKNFSERKSSVIVSERCSFMYIIMSLIRLSFDFDGEIADFEVFKR